MESAFGIDHGDYSEIEKVNPFSALGTAIGGASKLGAKKAGGLAGKIKPAAGATGIKAGAQKAGFGGLKGAGQGLKKVGGFAAQRPGLTGGLAAGGAATAAGGAGAMFGNRKRY